MARGWEVQPLVTSGLALRPNALNPVRQFVIPLNFHKVPFGQVPFSKLRLIPFGFSAESQPNVNIN